MVKYLRINTVFVVGPQDTTQNFVFDEGKHTLCDHLAINRVVCDAMLVISISVIFQYNLNFSKNENFSEFRGNSKIKFPKFWTNFRNFPEIPELLWTSPRGHESCI